MAYIDTSDLESTYATLEDLENLLDDVNNDLKDINTNTNSEIRCSSQNIKVDNSKEQKDAVGEVLKSFEIGVEGISDSNLNSITNTTFSSNAFENSNIDSNLSSLSGEKFSSGDYSGFDVNSVIQNETNQVDMKYLREQYSDERIDSLLIDDEMKELLKKCLNNEDAESFYLVAGIIDTQEQLKDSENEMVRIDDEILKTTDPSYKSKWCQNWCDENRRQSGKEGESGGYSDDEWSSAKSAFDEYRTSLDSAARAAKQNATNLRKSLIEKQAELSLMAYLPYYNAVSSTELEYNSNLFDTLPKDEMGLPLVSAPMGSAEGLPNINYILDHLFGNGYQEFLLSLVDENGNFILDREGWIVTTACSKEYSPLSLMETVEKTLDYLEKTGMNINRDEIIQYNGAYGELERKAYKLLDIQERNVYEKLYHEDPDSAHAYLEAMEVTLNNRAGFENAKKIYEWYITGDDSFERVFNIGVVGVGGGIVGWAENAHAFITGDITVTENEYTQQWFMQFVSTAFMTADIGEINIESLSLLKNYQIGEDTEGKPVYLLDDTAYNNLLSKLNKGETLNSNDVLYESKCMDLETYEFMQSVYDSPDFQNFLKQQDGSKFLWGDEEYWGNQVYSAANSVGNMLPSILIGAALAPAGAVFTVGTTTVTYGQIASNALMFLSSAGSSYKEAKRNGHTESDSRLYGVVSGVSELTTGYLLGRIPFVSKVSRVLEDFSASSHHVFVSEGLALISDILGEVKEEVAQIFISGAAEYFILGEDVTWKSLYAQIPDTVVSTVISTGITNGVPTVIKLGKYSLRVTVQDANQIASSSDPKQMITDLFFARFAPSKESQSLNNSNYTQEQIIYIASRLSSDEAILNTVDLITSDEMKAEVISNIIDNDIKLEALSKLNTSEAKLTVAVTLSDDSAKIKALPMIENLEEQKVLISTISKENQQEAIDVVNSTTLETKNSETTTNVSLDNAFFSKIDQIISLIDEKLGVGKGNEMVENYAETGDISDIAGLGLRDSLLEINFEKLKEYINSLKSSGNELFLDGFFNRKNNTKVNTNLEVDANNNINIRNLTDKERSLSKKINHEIKTNGSYNLKVNSSTEISLALLNSIDGIENLTVTIFDGLGDGNGKLKNKYNISDGKSDGKYLRRVTYTGLEAKSIITVIENLSAQVDNSKPSLERAKQIYKLIAETFPYSDFYKEPNGHRISASLLGITSNNMFGRKGLVCAGYAELFSELCKRNGIKCEYVRGRGYSSSLKTFELHAWNIITIDGVEIPVDCCWADANEGGELYKWFGPSDEFAARHVADSDETHKNYSISPEITRDLDLIFQQELVKCNYDVKKALKKMENGLNNNNYITRTEGARNIYIHVLSLYGPTIIQSYIKQKVSLEKIYQAVLTNTYYDYDDGVKMTLDAMQRGKTEHNPMLITSREGARDLFRIIPLSEVEKFVKIKHRQLGV